MSFTFKSVLTSDSETYSVTAENKNIGTVFKDKQKGIWAAILPESSNRESKLFESRDLAAEHLAKLAGLI